VSDADFSQVLSKFEWAKHQITALHEAVTNYVNQKPYTTVVSDDPDTQTYRVTLDLRQPPPAAIPHIVGDVLNSFQGTLDYLAWQLALREGGVPDFQTFFPIIKGSNQNVPDQRVNVFRSKLTERHRPALVTDEAVLEILRNVQPSNLPLENQRFHPLVILSTLNREAKHRYPAVLATAVANEAHVEIVGSGDAIDATLTVDFAGSVLKEGDEVASVA